MFRLLGDVLSFLKCMRYHGNVVFTAAGGERRVTVKRRGNARHSKMSKIHTLGLCIQHTQAELKGEKNSFQYKWMTSSESVSPFFLLATWKYPAEALGRVLLGSQDVNVNFLPVTEESLSLTLSLSLSLFQWTPGPLPHPWSRRFESKKPFCFFRLAIRH